MPLHGLLDLPVMGQSAGNPRTTFGPEVPQERIHEKIERRIASWAVRGRSRTDNQGIRLQELEV